MPYRTSIGPSTIEPDDCAETAWVLDFVNSGSGAPAGDELPLPDRRILAEEAATLRAILDRFFESLAAGSPPMDEVTFALDRTLSSASRSHRLTMAGTSPRIAVHWVGEGPLALLAPMAYAALGVLSRVDPRRLRRCASPSCRTWFVDTSKAGRRRWCSMARCGNRAKAARFRERQAQ